MSSQVPNERTSLPCTITGMVYIPHSVLRKLDVERNGVKPIQKMIDTINKLEGEKSKLDPITKNEEIKEIQREIDARTRNLNTIKRHLDPNVQRGKGYKFRIGGTQYDKFTGGSFFEEAREIKEFSRGPQNLKAIPANKKELISNFITRIEDMGFRYPEDTGGLRKGSSSNILESSEGVRIYPTLNIPIKVYVPLNTGEGIYRKKKGDEWVWVNRGVDFLNIERAFNPYNIGQDQRVGRKPKKPVPKGDDTVTSAFTDTAVVLRNAITINKTTSKTSDDVMNAISGKESLEELEKLLEKAPSPREVTVRLPDGQTVTAMFYERRKRYGKQHQHWEYSEGKYKPISDNRYTPICREGHDPEDPVFKADTSTIEGCMEAARQAEKKSKKSKILDFTCVMHENKCNLAKRRIFPAGVPKGLQRVWGIDTPLIKQMKMCRKQLQRV